jgi:hypothetical protein
MATTSASTNAMTAILTTAMVVLQLARLRQATAATTGAVYNHLYVCMRVYLLQLS